MIVYRASTTRLSPAAVLRAARATAPDADAALERLIALGRVEAAVLDAADAAGDGWTPRHAAWRAALGAAARAWRTAETGRPRVEVAPHEAVLRAALLRVAADDLPRAVAAGVPEGFAWYGVHPRGYAAAARAFASGRPRGVATVVGVRGIGTTLSAVVAAELEARGWDVATVTVRPRGHPFDRVLRTSAALDALVRARAQQGRGDVLVADEGPGLSGSSFASVCEWAGRLGVGADRIVLLPSWDPDPSALRSIRARASWRRHPRHVADFGDPGARVAAALGARVVADWSAGGWRSALPGPREAAPPAHPRHERRKFLLDAGRGDLLVARDAGLGEFGRAAERRARLFADAGRGPAVRGLDDGFLVLEHVAGRPATRGDLAVGLEVAAREHAAFVARAFPADEGTRTDDLFEMIDVNVRELLGPRWRATLGDVERFRPELDAAPVAVDGRMLPHEFVARPDGSFVKLDALDHHADHFWPGATGAGWDRASFAVECGLRPAEGDAVWALAYLAFRAAYAELAASTLDGTPDGAAQRGRAAALRAALARAVARCAGRRSAA